MLPAGLVHVVSSMWIMWITNQTRHYDWDVGCPPSSIAGPTGQVRCKFKETLWICWGPAELRRVEILPGCSTAWLIEL